MPPNKKYVVFVSSTFIDLIEERKCVANALALNGYWHSGMELFGARSDPPINVIRSEIRDSDYYILICSARYGSIYKDGISFTEYEYNYALGIGKKPLVFLGHGPALPGTVLGVEIREFRAKLEAKHTVSYFTNTNDLTMNVIQALGDHIRNFPRNGWVPGGQTDKIRVHVDQHERTAFYRLIVKNAKKDVFIFGTTLANVSTDHDRIIEKLKAGVKIRMLGLDPTFVSNGGATDVFDSFFSKSVSTADMANFATRIVAAQGEISKLRQKISGSAFEGNLEYRTYRFFPTANMTVVDGMLRSGQMVFEHIAKDNGRITFHDIGSSNVAFQTIREQYEGYWAAATKVF